jgi:hypothetical protein
MTNRVHIQEELESISKAVAGIPLYNPYRLPAGYFDTLPELIVARVLSGISDESAVLNVSGKEVPFEVPSGYFDQLSTAVMAKIKDANNESAQEELEQISPVVAAISKANVYELPVNYFEKLEIPFAAASKQQTAKVITLSASRYWLRIAAAVIIVLGLSTGLYLSSTSNTQQSGAIAKGLKIKTEKQFQEKLDQVDANDLVAYLQSTGSPDEIREIKAMVDSKDLPEETDYLDQEFLETYLQELENNSATLN